VIGLGWRTLALRGPSITIAFDAGEGIQSGQTRIRRKDVDLGTVESIGLASALSHVLVRARMLRSAAPYLNDRTQFWIVRPRVSAEGISGLSTLVSGVFIEMSPGGGSPKREFVGLEQPPVLQPDTPGRSFTLHAAQLSALNQGSAVFYRGLSVGEILGYTLDQKTQQIDIYAFVRTPYDQLVHAETRFWNASGIDISLGAQGAHMVASSWQQLLSGGVEFPTPPEAMGEAASPPRATRSRSSRVRTNPPPVPPSVYAGLITSGRPISSANPSTASRALQTRDGGTGSPIDSSISLKAWRSSARRIVSRSAPSRRTPCRSISAAANGAIKPNSNSRTASALEIWAVSQPNSRPSGRISAPGMPTAPAVVSAVRKVTPATIQA